jgi:hypothetical protein
MKNILTLLVAAWLVVGTANIVHGQSGTETGPAGDGVGPVYIDSAEVLYLESWPVQVQLWVTGSVPTPCHEVAYEVQDFGSSLDVLLWSITDPAADCIAVLEPFELGIPLGSYESADLPVLLNGEQIGRIDLGDVTPGPVLQGAGWSFGFCLGYCNADLHLDGDELVLTVSDRAGDSPLFINRGSLTAEGRASLDAALAALDGVKLEPVYGCPDCADGGAAHLDIVRGSETMRVEMGFGQPPEVLAELYVVAMSLIDSLETCEPGPLVETDAACSPYQERA